MMIILSITSSIDDEYQYNMYLKDNKETSKYLNEKYFDDKEIKKIDKGAYLFENNFSKNYITSDMYNINHLKIMKIIREDMRDMKPSDEFENKEKQYIENYIEQSKKGLMKRFWG